MQIRKSGLKDKYLTWTTTNKLIEKEFNADISLTKFNLICFFIEKKKWVSLWNLIMLICPLCLANHF